MQQNRQYAPYRPPLTEEQKKQIHDAENPMKAYGSIALAEAKKQLSVAVNSSAGQNAMPENAEACLRFPAIDPKGQYSIIDMKVKRRTQDIEAALSLRDKAVGALVGETLNKHIGNGKGNSRSVFLFTITPLKSTPLSAQCGQLKEMRAEMLSICTKLLRKLCEYC